MLDSCPLSSSELPLELMRGECGRLGMDWLAARIDARTRKPM